MLNSLAIVNPSDEVTAVIEAAPTAEIALKADETRAAVIPTVEVTPVEVVDTWAAEFEDMVSRFQRLTLDEPIVIDVSLERMLLRLGFGWAST